MVCKTENHILIHWGTREIKAANMVDLLELDAEWVELIIEAKNMGMQLEEVRVFFETRKKDEIVGTDLVSSE